jgi:predicted ester cyclase
MHLTPPTGIMDVADPVGKTRVGKRRRRRRNRSMSVEGNMALVRRFLEARVKGDLDTIDEMMAPHFVNHTPLLSVQASDREGVKWVFAQFAAAVSNSSVHFEDQIAAGDKVVTRFILRATHDRGELMGVAPSGREMAVMPVVIHRIVEGKIAEEWGGGMGLSELLRRRRLEQEIGERERIEQELQVATSQPGRWEETSTTFTCSRTDSLASSSETPRVRASPQRW